MSAVKRRLDDKDAVISRLTVATENIQTDVATIQHTPPSNNNPFGDDNSGLDSSFAKFDDLKPILLEIQTIKAQIENGALSSTNVSTNPTNTTNFVTTKDLRGLVLEISRISQMLPTFATEERVVELVANIESSRIESSGSSIAREQIVHIVEGEIEKIWPMVDDLVVNAAIETKERAYNDDLACILFIYFIINYY